jgi:putative SOS response-associated peptidase YedK
MHADAVGGLSGCVARGRCLVPVDGFYEWHGISSDRRPFWFHDRGGKPFALTVLAEERTGSLAFFILTTAANELMRPVRDRMSVVLSAGSADAWLTSGDESILVPAPESWLVCSRRLAGRERRGE